MWSSAPAERSVGVDIGPPRCRTELGATAPAGAVLLDVVGEDAQCRPGEAGHAVGEAARAAPRQSPTRERTRSLCRVVTSRDDALQSAARAGSPNMHGPHWPADSPAAQVRQRSTKPSGQSAGSRTSRTPGPVRSADTRQVGVGPEQPGHVVGPDEAAAEPADEDGRRAVRQTARQIEQVSHRSARCGLDDDAPCRRRADGDEPRADCSGVPNDRNHPRRAARSARPPDRLGVEHDHRADPAALGVAATADERLPLRHGRASPPCASETIADSSDET